SRHHATTAAPAVVSRSGPEPGQADTESPAPRTPRSNILSKERLGMRRGDIRPVANHSRQLPDPRSIVGSARASLTACEQKVIRKPPREPVAQNLRVGSRTEEHPAAPTVIDSDFRQA